MPSRILAGSDSVALCSVCLWTFNPLGRQRQHACPCCANMQLLGYVLAKGQWQFFILDKVGQMLYGAFWKRFIALYHAAFDRAGSDFVYEVRDSRVPEEHQPKALLSQSQRQRCSSGGPSRCGPLISSFLAFGLR